MVAAISMTDGWLPDLTGRAGPKYQAVADALGLAIERGDLRPGDRLPPQRELAARLGMDLTTVTRAFEIARQRGQIVARGRSGSFVREREKAPAAGAFPIDTAMNAPPLLPDEILQRAMVETVQSLFSSGFHSRLQYQLPGGAPEDRDAGARLLTRRGLPSAADQVIVTAGGQNALHAVLNAALRPGDAVACGRFVYSGFKALAERLGLRLAPLDEMSAASLEAACQEHDLRALYVVPTNDNPTAVTLSLAERQAIAAVVQRRSLQVIEDDAYGALPSDPTPPIASFAPENCWHISSMSKVISPALRVAFLRAPSVSHALRLASDVQLSAIMAPPINAAMVTRWIGDGTYERLVAATRMEGAYRQELARKLLAGLPFRAHPQGYHLWLPLAEPAVAQDMVHALRPSGLSVVTSDKFLVGQSGEHTLRVSMGGLIERDELARALRTLAGYLTSSPPRTSLLV